MNVQKGKGLLYYHATYASAYFLEFTCSYSKLEVTSIHICEIVALYSFWGQNMLAKVHVFVSIQEIISIVIVHPANV